MRIGFGVVVSAPNSQNKAMAALALVPQLLTFGQVQDLVEITRFSKPVPPGPKGTHRHQRILAQCCNRSPHLTCFADRLAAR